MFLEIFLYSYLITTCISISIMPIRTYRMGKDKYGERQSMVTAFQVAGCCLVPYVGFAGVLYITYKASKDKLGSWLKNDPTSPVNKADPKFNPPPKKVKKVKPVEPIGNRFEIMDL